MHYVYILYSPTSHKFYFGSANDLSLRTRSHNNGEVRSTKFGRPWGLAWYAAFETEKQARDFERYLKSGSGRTFAYKRLISVALEKDFKDGRKGSPKHKT